MAQGIRFKKVRNRPDLRQASRGRHTFIATASGPLVDDVWQLCYRFGHGGAVVIEPAVRGEHLVTAAEDYLVWNT